MNQLAAVDDGVSALGFLQDDALFNRVERFSQIMASGRATIPVELRNPGDCMAITLQAMQWKMNPISLAQKVFFINGKIGYEAQAIAAAINGSSAVSSPFEFEWFGPWEKIVGRFIERESKTKKDDNGYPVKYRVPGWNIEDEAGCGVRVQATLRGESSPRVLELLMAQARTRNSTMWADDPKQQIAYLAQKKWARLYAPQIILGAYTPDELTNLAEIDMGAAEVVATKPTAAQQTRQTEKPEYTQPAFEADRDSVKKAVKSGRMTIEAALERIRGKFVLSQEWENSLRTYVSAEEAEPAISAEQAADLEALADEYNADIAALCKQFGAARLTDIPVRHMSELIALIKQES